MIKIQAALAVQVVQIAMITHLVEVAPVLAGMDFTKKMLMLFVRLVISLVQLVVDLIIINVLHVLVLLIEIIILRVVEVAVLVQMGFIRLELLFNASLAMLLALLALVLLILNASYVIHQLISLQVL